MISVDAESGAVVVASVPHHLTQWGSNRQDVFLGDDDRRRYLEQRRKDCRDYGIRMIDCCLMTNHVHLIAIPETATIKIGKIGGAGSPPCPPVALANLVAC